MGNFVKSISSSKRFFILPRSTSPGPLLKRENFPIKTFSITERFLNNSGVCWTVEILHCLQSVEILVATGLSFSKRLPESEDNTPDKIRTRVDFPEAFSPVIA